MKTALVIAVLALAGWAWERADFHRLLVEIEVRRNQRSELTALRRTGGLLRSRCAPPSELTAMRAALTAPDAPVRDAVESTGIALGEWAPYTAWHNEGQATPMAALDTALAAAATGNVALFDELLDLTDSERARLRAMHDNLPAKLQAAYPRPESLVSAVSIRNIPLGSAQVVWIHETDTEHAVACVFLRAVPYPSEQPSGAPADVRSAPTVPLLLSFHRDGSSWGLVVPKQMVDDLQLPNTWEPPGDGISLRPK